MKNNKLVNIVLIMIIIFSVLFVAKETFAANNNTPGLEDLTNTLTNRGNNTSGNSTSGNIANDSNNNTVNNSVLRTDNTSNYNNSNLPNTGIEDSVPSVILLVVFGISAIYAYKKIQDYKNI